LDTRFDRGSLKFWLSAWFPVFFCIVVIVIESTEMLGADHTSSPLRWVFETLFGRVGERSWNSIHHILRKSGHFLGYGTIGLIWFRAWWMSLPRSRFLQDVFLSLMGTAMIASADEFHQGILPNRTGTPWDVLLDCSGALVLQLIVYIYMRVWRPKRLERAA
jgi:VanZ family protein